MSHTFLALSPVVVLTFGLMLVIARLIHPFPLLARAVTANQIARVNLGLAFLATAREWIVDRGQPVDVTVFSPTTLDTFVVPWSTILGSARVDVLALGGLSFAILIGFVELAVVPEPSEGPEIQALVVSAGCLFAGLLMWSADSISVTTLWFAFSLLGIGTMVASQKFSPTRLADGSEESASTTFADLRGWLTLALIAAPALLFADSILVSMNGGPFLLGGHPIPRGFPIALVLVGAATAGLSPLNGWRDGPDRHPEVAYIADALAPLAGFALAARGMGTSGARSEPVVLILLFLIGFWGHTRLPRSSIRHPGFATVAQIDRSLAFILLIAPFHSVTYLGLLIVGFGALGRALQRVPDRERSLRLRPTLAIFPKSTPTPRPRSTPTVESGPARLRRRAPDLLQRIANRGAEAFFVIEDRYDIAVGVLVALSVLFAFAG